MEILLCVAKIPQSLRSPVVIFSHVIPSGRVRAITNEIVPRLNVNLAHFLAK